MAKRFVISCAALLASSLVYIKNVDATLTKIRVPVEIVIDSQNIHNSRAVFLGAIDELPKDMEWFGLPNLAIAYNPEKPNEVVFIDVKKAIIKLVAKNPELAKQAGITEQDFADAGISQDALLALQKESMSESEVEKTIDFVLNAFFYGDLATGAMCFLDGGGDLMKACGKMGLGSAILIKKAVAGIINLVQASWNEIS